MKKTLLLLTLISTSIFSQTITYGFSEEFETVKGYNFIGTIKCNSNELIKVSYKIRKPMRPYIQSMALQSFDNNVKSLLKQEYILFPDNEKKQYHAGLFSSKNNTYWLLCDINNNIPSLFALPFNKKVMKFDTSKIKLLDADSYDLFFNLSGYIIKHSNDSSKMLVVYGINPKNKKNNLYKKKVIIGFNSKKMINNSINQIIAINLFDTNLKKIYSAEITIPILKDNLQALNYLTDSKGNIYIIVGYLDSNKEYQSELFKVNQKDNTLQSVKINLEDKYINSFYLKEDSNNNLIITGLYSNKKNKSSAAGAYIIKPEFDENNILKKTKNTFSEYPAEVLKSYKSARMQRKMDKKNEEGDLEAENLQFKKIIFNSDGSTVIIAEEYSMQISTLGVGKDAFNVVYYTYGDILVLKLDKLGKTIWCNKIPKYQSSSNTDSDLSFHHHQHNGDNYFFYLDNEENLNLSLSETPHPYANGFGIYLTCVKIGADGKMVKNSIFNIKNEAKNLSPASFESISENLIINYIKDDKKKTSKIFRIEIK